MTKLKCYVSVQVTYLLDNWIFGSVGMLLEEIRLQRIVLCE